MQTRSKLHTKRDVLSKWVLGMSTGFSLEELVGPLERVFSIKRKTIHRYMSDWVTKYTPLHLVLSKIPPHLSLAPISWLNGLDAMAAQIFHTLCICVFVYLYLHIWSLLTFLLHQFLGSMGWMRWWPRYSPTASLPPNGAWWRQWW